MVYRWLVIHRSLFCGQKKEVFQQLRTRRQEEQEAYKVKSAGEQEIWKAKKKYIYFLNDF